MDGIFNDFESRDPDIWVTCKSWSGYPWKIVFAMESTQNSPDFRNLKLGERKKYLMFLREIMLLRYRSATMQAETGLLLIDVVKERYVLIRIHDMIMILHLQLLAFCGNQKKTSITSWTIVRGVTRCSWGFWKKLRNSGWRACWWNQRSNSTGRNQRPCFWRHFLFR